MSRGDLNGSSFDSYPTKTTYQESEAGTLCVIEDCDLPDVGPVTFPAYEGTTAGFRACSEDHAKSARQQFENPSSKSADANGIGLVASTDVHA